MDGSRSNTHNTQNNRHESGKLKHLEDFVDVDDGFMTPPHDPKALQQTRALLTALHEIKGQNKFLFGHQEDNVHGQKWQDRTGEHYWYSDIYNSTGSYPGLFGYSLQATDKNDWDYSEPIKYAYEKQGAVIEILWAAWNPITLGNENNLTRNACMEVLPGRSANEVWKGWLDNMADALHNLTDSSGAKIPAILRLFHENTGNWYWWGTKYCNATDYVAMWNYTQTYLRDEKDVHQLLYVYAPNAPANGWEEAYEEYYPGDDLVDIIGFDRYGYQDGYPAGLLADCQKVTNFSRHHNKIAAIAETGITGGIQDVTDPMWYMNNFTNVIMNDPLNMCQDVVYSLTWFNRHAKWYWVPNWGQSTWPGFKAFHESEYSMFADDTTWHTLRNTFGYSTAAFSPTSSPTTPAPTNDPTFEPSYSPTPSPTDAPSVSPTSEPTYEPTVAPTAPPTIAPTTKAPTKAPSEGPTTGPTKAPTTPPTIAPTTKAPTKAPSEGPTTLPTVSPTIVATTASPTDETSSSSHHSHCGKGCSVAIDEDGEADTDTASALSPAWQQQRTDGGKGKGKSSSQ